MHMTVRPLLLPFGFALAAASGYVSAQPASATAPIASTPPTASATPPQVTGTAGAGNCPRPPGGTVNYSNCTDPDGPGQGELHLHAPIQLPRPDLMLLPQLRLGTLSGQWGDRLQVPAVANAAGRCQVRLQIGVMNGGQRASDATRHLLRQRPLLLRNDSPGRTLAELQQPSLAPGETRTFELTVPLSAGTSWIEAELDVDDAVKESNEGNNRRRVQIQLDPACG